MSDDSNVRESKVPAEECLPVCVTKDVFVSGTDVKTTIILQIFADRVFVVLTNYKRFGSILECSATVSEIDQALDYRVQTLLGKRDDTVNDVYARQILEHFVKVDQLNDPLSFSKGIKPLLLSIALKEEMRTPTNFRELLNHVIEIYKDIS